MKKILMIALTILLVVILFLPVLSACGDDKGIEGTYVSSKNNATIKLMSNGKFSASITRVAEMREDYSGTYGVENETITFTAYSPISGEVLHTTSGTLLSENRIRTSFFGDEMVFQKQ